jgi:hypothetical protein
VRTAANATRFAVLTVVGKRLLHPIYGRVHFKPAPSVESVGNSLAICVDIKCRSAQGITATAALVVDTCVVLVVIIQSDRNRNLATGPSPLRAALAAKEDPRNKSVVLFEGVQSGVVHIVERKQLLEMKVNTPKQLRI